MKQTTIFFVGSGIGRDLRGFEAHISDLFHHVRNEKDFNSHLIKASGQRSFSEVVARSLGRKQWPAKAIGFFLGKNAHFVQQTSFLAGLIPLLYRYQPTVLYLGEPILFNYLYRWRNISGMKFRMIFFTGGNTVPLKMRSDDLLQLVTPAVIPLATQRGITSEQMVLLPHFLDIKPAEAGDKKAMRIKLGIPDNRVILLSVGAIDASVKRMDYLIDEVSRLAIPFYLIMLGEHESETPAIRKLAETKLGSKNFHMSRVDRSALGEYYKASDIFILASLKEGFGLVTIEAMHHGLPVVVHPHEVSKFVLGDMGIYSDLTKSGNLTTAMKTHLIDNEQAAEKRKQYIYDRFSWDNLSGEYLKLINRASGR
ncbi:hypothetical protein BH10BAC4_BH10BAC4_21220 [soil metagenome]